MLGAAEPAQIHVPGVIGAVHAQLIHAGLQQIVALLTLAAADQLAHARHQHIRRSNSLAVLVLAHVEALDLLGIIGHEHGLLENLLGEVALVLGLQIHTPFHLVLELVVVLLQQLHGVGVADAGKLGVHQSVQPLQQTLVEELVEEGHLVRALLQHIADHILHHGFGVIHVIGQIRKGHLGLDHPELGGVAGGVGILGAEGGAEGVDLTEGQRHGLALQLTGHGQVGAAAEEILAEIHLAVLGAGQVVQVQSGHAEHLAGALTVGTGDQWGVHIHKAVLLEELVDGISRGAAHTERRRKGVGAGTQMGHGAQKFHAVALFLQGIIGGAYVQQLHAVGVDLQRLLGAGGQYHTAHNLHAGAHAGLGHVLVVFQLGSLEHDLQVLEAGAVAQLNEADVLGIPHGLGPAAHGHNGTVRRGGAEQRLDVDAFHVFSPLKMKKSGSDPVLFLGRIAAGSAVPPNLPPDRGHFSRSKPSAAA